jgi:hypothetical protein
LCCEESSTKDVFDLTAKDLKKIRKEAEKKLEEDLIQKEKENQKAIREEVVTILTECKRITEEQCRNGIYAECSLFVRNMSEQTTRILTDKGFRIELEWDTGDVIEGLTIYW